MPRAATPLRDVLLGLVAAADEPIAGGRHKVFGHPASPSSRRPRRSPRTCRGRVGARVRASAGPRELGARRAVAGRRGRGLQLRRRLGQPLDRGRRVQRRGAHRAYQRLPLPLLFVCEDNGIGISVPTPAGWVERDATADRPGLRYVAADGSDLADGLTTRARGPPTGSARTGAPAFLHLRTVRLMGHAGSDVETAYRAAVEIAPT